MKASSSPLATAAATIAFSRNAAGPSRHNFSKTEAITQSQIRIGARLRASLIRGHQGHVLPRRKAVSQSAAIGLRREAPDLVDLRKVLGANRKENASGELRCSPSA